MDKMIIARANAKINLTLDVIGRRDDGYHLIRSVMQSISLCDEVRLSFTSNKTISLSCSDSRIPCDERNTVYKACVKFFNFTGVTNPGIEIFIDKHIPSEAGLGGGSSDAAVIIKLLDKAFGTKLSLDQMIMIGSQVGADVPFCIVSGTALCEGLGEIVTPLKDIRKYYVLLVKPDFGVSTPLAYKMFDEKSVVTKNSTNIMLDAILDHDNISNLLSNDLESAIDNKDIDTIKNELIEFGANGSLMSGSGSCVYGLFSDKEYAFTAFNKLKDKYPFVFLSETI